MPLFLVAKVPLCRRIQREELVTDAPRHTHFVALPADDYPQSVVPGRFVERVAQGQRIREE